MLKYFEMLALTLSFHIVIILVSNGENFTLIPFWAVKILLWCPFEQWNFIVMPFRAGILQFCSRTTFSSRAGETYTPMIAFVRFQINVAIMFRKYSFYLPQIDEVICSPSIASNREVTGLKLQNVKKGANAESFEFSEWISSEKIEFKQLKSTWVSKGKSLRFMGQARVRLTFWNNLHHHHHHDCYHHVDHHVKRSSACMRMVVEYMQYDEPTLFVDNWQKIRKICSVDNH